MRPANGDPPETELGEEGADGGEKCRVAAGTAVALAAIGCLSCPSRVSFELPFDKEVKLLGAKSSASFQMFPALLFPASLLFVAERTNSVSELLV